VIYYLPYHWGALSGHWEKILPGANGQLDPEEGFILLVSQGEGLRCTKNPVRHRNQLGKGSTTHQTGKNPSSNSGLLQGGRRGE
jgi:hypothetical protein